MGKIAIVAVLLASFVALTLRTIKFQDLYGSFCDNHPNSDIVRSASTYAHLFSFTLMVQLLTYVWLVIYKITKVDLLENVCAFLVSVLLLTFVVFFFIFNVIFLIDYEGNLDCVFEFKEIAFMFVAVVIPYMILFILGVGYSLFYIFTFCIKQAYCVLPLIPSHFYDLFVHTKVFI